MSDSEERKHIKWPTMVTRNRNCCPNCGSIRILCKKTVTSHTRGVINRKYDCDHCHVRFPSKEEIPEVDIPVLQPWTQRAADSFC